MYMEHSSREASGSEEVQHGSGATLPVCPPFCTIALLIAGTAFLGRDNVIEVALGLIIGAAFSNVVTSLVSDVILPPISLISPDARNLESHFWILRAGETPGAIYNTVDQAAADGKTVALTVI